MNNFDLVVFALNSFLSLPLTLSLQCPFVRSIPVHSSLSFQQFDQIIFDDDQNGSNIEEKTKRRRSIELNRIELNCLKMNFVRVSGRIGLTSLCLSLICSFISLIFYLISFCLSDWIFYQTIPIKIGLWKLCDVQVRHLFLFLFSSLLFICFYFERSSVMIDVQIGTIVLIQRISPIMFSVVHQVFVFFFFFFSLEFH